MAKTLKTQITEARAAYDLAHDNIFAFVDNDTTPFDKCFKSATPDLQEAHYAARMKVADLEAEAISKGRAWRNALGVLQFYR